MTAISYKMWFSCSCKVSKNIFKKENSRHLFIDVVCFPIQLIKYPCCLGEPFVIAPFWLIFFLCEQPTHTGRIEHHRKKFNLIGIIISLKQGELESTLFKLRCPLKLWYSENWLFQILYSLNTNVSSVYPVRSRNEHNHTITRLHISTTFSGLSCPDKWEQNTQKVIHIYFM